MVDPVLAQKIADILYIEDMPRVPQMYVPELPAPSVFVTHPEYLGLGDEPFPHVLEVLDEILLGGYSEAYLCWGIGSGKSYLSSLALAYIAADVLRRMALGEFWSDYNLAEGTLVQLGCFAGTYTLAREVVFEELQSKLAQSPWFEKYFPVDPKVKRYLRFLLGSTPYQMRLLIAPYGCSRRSALGRNMFAAVIDEASWWEQRGEQTRARIVGEANDIAQELYERVDQRIRSRFGEEGLVISISSARSVDDWIQRKLREAEDDPRIFAECLPTWKVKTRWRRKETFELDGEEIPIELKPAFDRDPERAWRDYGSRPFYAHQPFDPHAADIFSEPPPPFGRGPDPQFANPVDSDWKTLWNAEQFDKIVPSLSITPAVRYYMHIDLGLTGDAMGLAVAHAEKMEEWEDPVLVVLDFTLRLLPEECGGEIRIASIREFIYAFIKRYKRDGLAELFVSMDGFQSADCLQLLRERGVPAYVMSVDKSTAYYDLKELLHSGHLLYADDDFWMRREYMRLEYQRGRIDHPPEGSKDVADAVAAACAQAAAWGRSQWGSARPPSLRVERNRQHVADIMTRRGAL